MIFQTRYVTWNTFKKSTLFDNDLQKKHLSQFTQPTKELLNLS